MDDVGSRIKEERKKNKITIEQLAKRTGLSKGFISQIERGLAHPSITTLKKIAHSFQISVVTLFGNTNEENEQESAVLSKEVDRNKVVNEYIQDITIVRTRHRKKMILPGSHITYEMVSPDLNRKLQVLYLRLDPGETSGKRPIIDPTGEKCILVLKGQLEFTVGEETMILESGDSIYFPASLPQSWKGIGNTHIEAIITMTPPWF
ncbi:MAG: helix-turn-helix transcriptional regulator [Bacteroidetes bacterium]|nr:helix-turn-helix transcriptional regulator [Bacteroidota bacterium]